MTVFEWLVPAFFLGLAGLVVLDARRSARRLEAKAERHPAE